uniref:hypothetical protein n=1 Tax=Allorhizocola rhizosphaerae TaxID=1872709 RepID=UPI0013C2E934
MPVTREELRAAAGMFTSLQPLSNDRNGHISAISVTINGIEGSSQRATRSVPYRILISVQNLQAELPAIWIASPPDNQIRHVNIFRATQVCPFTDTRLPTLCWGQTPRASQGASTADRRLANQLEAVRQVLSNANTSAQHAEMGITDAAVTRLRSAYPDIGVIARRAAPGQRTGLLGRLDARLGQRALPVGEPPGP